jgi:hypothetical protein
VTVTYSGLPQALETTFDAGNTAIGVGGATYADYDAYSPTCSRNRKTGAWTCKYSQYDGSYINASGGLDINLLPGNSTDVSMTFALGDVITSLAPSTMPAECSLINPVTTDSLDFRFNILKAARSGDSSVGIASLNPGESIDGKLTGAETLHVAGVVNFGIATTSSATVSGALYFNSSHDYGSWHWNGDSLTLSRSGSGDSYTLTSSAESQVFLQCYVRSTMNGQVNVYDVGVYHVPFSLTTQVIPHDPSGDELAVVK